MKILIANYCNSKVFVFIVSAVSKEIAATIVSLKIEFKEKGLFYIEGPKFRNLGLGKTTTIPDKSIWNKIEKFSKTGQEKKSLISIFA